MEPVGHLKLMMLQSARTGAVLSSKVNVFNICTVLMVEFPDSPISG